MTTNKHFAAIASALDQLEAALNAAGRESGICYEDAVALFHRSDLLTVRIEEAILCAAPDYPDEPEDDEETPE